MEAVGGASRPRARPVTEWQRRPGLSFAVRTAVFVIPIGLSLAAAILLSNVLPRAHDPWSALGWVLVIAAIALLTLVVFERLARRFLPLAALLNVSLVFPDHAPRRFAVARRTGRARDLHASLAAAQAAGRRDEASRLSTVIELVLAMTVHDRATRGHSERVRVFVDMIADELKLSPESRAKLRWAALLHDVGKVAVPTGTLNKLHPLTDDEWTRIHAHPQEGARLVAPLLPWLDVWGAAVAEHHERFDGTGYPNHLSGCHISLGARIVSVADCYEVMTAPRAYKRPMSVAAARAELTRGAGSQFDPQIVRTFLNVSVGRLWRSIGIGALIAQIPTFNRLASSFGNWSAPAFAGSAAAVLFAVGGLGPPSHAGAPPGAVAGIQAHGGNQPAPPTGAPSGPSPIATPPPLIAIVPSGTPVPRLPDTTHYPYQFTMKPLRVTPPALPTTPAPGSLGAGVSVTVHGQVQIQMSPLPLP